MRTVKITFTDKDFGQIELESYEIQKILFVGRERQGIMIEANGNQYVPGNPMDAHYIFAALAEATK